MILVFPPRLEVELPYLLTELRADSDVGRLPLVLVTPQARPRDLNRLVDRLANVTLLPEAVLGMPEQLQERLENAIKFAVQPDTVQKVSVEQKVWLDEAVKKGKGRA